MFTIPYKPVELKAVGLNEELEIESTVLKTSGEASHIRLSADRTEIKANWHDFSFISIKLTDDTGTSNPTAINRLHFEIEGPGTIIGVANGDIKDTDPYIGNARKAFHGRAMVVVRSSHIEGDIKLDVCSMGF